MNFFHKNYFVWIVCGVVVIACIALLVFALNSPRAGKVSTRNPPVFSPSVAKTPVPLRDTDESIQWDRMPGPSPVKVPLTGKEQEATSEGFDVSPEDGVDDG